jgi:adenylate cyclase
MAQVVDWERLLIDGDEPLKRAQRIYRRLPHDPRCKLCLCPFAGIGGKLCALAGRKPSRKNPNLCTACFNNLPSGGIELDIAVVFADVRGSTAIGEQSSATAFANRLNRFYATATDVLIRHDGLIDKLIGDEVMALFIPGISGPGYRRVAAVAALDLAEAIRDMPIGVAANAGIAFVGNVGSGAVVDFTALGDAVNLGARLQSHAAPGEVVLSAELYELVSADYPGARSELVDVRGRDEPVPVAVLTVG